MTSKGVHSILHSETGLGVLLSFHCMPGGNLVIGCFMMLCLITVSSTTVLLTGSCLYHFGGKFSGRDYVYEGCQRVHFNLNESHIQLFCKTIQKRYI